jgi:hypothetical protein
MEEPMRRTAFALLLVILSGCTGVPYAPKGSTIYKGGYSDKKLSEGEYLVRFEGNGYNTMPQVVEFVKRRATELCGSSDFDATVRQFFTSDTEMGFVGGSVYSSQHRFPNAEAQVRCK